MNISKILSITFLCFNIYSTLISQSLPGDYYKQINVDGVSRNYLLHLPAGFDNNKQYPIVMVLHADNSTAAEIMTQTGFSALSNRKEFIVVYPDGTGLKKLSWNDGNCCGYAAQSGVNDVAFLDLIIRELAAKYNIKPNEIFVCGFQHGANMVYKYACETKTVISGIAIVGNTTYNNKCKPTHNIKALFVRDTTIAVIKNKVFFKKKKKQADAGIPAHVEFWIMSNNCLPNATNEVKNDCQIKIFYNSQQSERVRMVQFYKPLSSWPGEVTEYSSNKISSFKATDEIWNFFTSK